MLRDKLALPGERRPEERARDYPDEAKTDYYGQKERKEKVC